jgi:hypothetical protein
MFMLAIEQDVVASNPCRKVKKLLMDNARTRYLSVEEEGNLMEALTGRLSHLRPMIIVAIDTGLRRGRTVESLGGTGRFQPGRDQREKDQEWKGEDGAENC